MNKLFEIYADNGKFILEATDFAKALLNQSNGKIDNLKGVDFKELDIPVEPSARIFQICEVIRYVCNGNDFSSAFSGCIKLTNIPWNIFQNNNNASNFRGAFTNCNSLTYLNLQLQKKHLLCYSHLIHKKKVTLLNIWAQLSYLT